MNLKGEDVNDSDDPMHCMLTRRGKHLAQITGVWVGWAAGLLLITVSVLWHTTAVLVFGFVVLVIAATYTCVLVILWREDVLLAAFEVGRRPGLDGTVTSIR